VQGGDDLLAEVREGVAAADVQPQRDSRAALLLDGGDRVLRAGLVTAVGQDDAGAALGELDGRALPDARAGAGDDRDPHDGSYLFVFQLRLGCLNQIILSMENVRKMLLPSCPILSSWRDSTHAPRRPA
jgi:hypothetical protein